jgi:hypothetical protein
MTAPDARAAALPDDAVDAVSRELGAARVSTPPEREGGPAAAAPLPAASPLPAQAPPPTAPGEAHTHLPTVRTSDRDALLISALLRAGSEPGAGSDAANSPASPPPVLTTHSRRVTSPTPAEVDAALGGLPDLLEARGGGGGGGEAGTPRFGSRISQSGLDSGDDSDTDGDEEEDASGRGQDGSWRRAQRSESTRVRLASADDSDPFWRSRTKHFLVFTQAGKPVFSRYGDTASLAGFTASLAALCAFTVDTAGGGRGEQLRSFRSATHQFVFLHRGQLTLVCISATGEPEAVLRRQLHLLHSLVVCLLTSGVDKTLAKSPKFDPRTLLGGTERVFSRLVRSFTWDPSTWTAALAPLPLSVGARRSATAALAAACATHGLLTALLVTPDRLVASAQPRRAAALHPDDVLLVCTLVRGARSFRDASESFSPVCLPRYNSAAFVYAYVAWLAPVACLVLLTPSPEGFPGCAEARKTVELAFTREKVLLAVFSAQQRSPAALAAALQRPPGGGGIGALVSGTLWHFLYLAQPHGRAPQLVCPPFGPPLTDRASQRAVMRAYAALHSDVHGGASVGTTSTAAGTAGGVSSSSGSSALTVATGASATLAALTSSSATAAAAQQQQQQPQPPPYQHGSSPASVPAVQRVHLRSSDEHCLLAVVGDTFELYAVFDPLTETPAAVGVANRLCAWLRTQDVELLCP